MILSMIVAASENNAIGKEGKMPWRLSADLKHFKELTWGMPVIMGRKTFESIGKPLPGRINIVITSDKNWHHETVRVAADVNDAIRQAKDTGCLEAFIIGGGQVYSQMMEMVGRIYLTRVHAHIEGDAFFPEPDPQIWKQSGNREHPADEKNNYAYSFQCWERK